MKQPLVYLDHNATTPPHPELRDMLLEWFDLWGNPSSIHGGGRGPKKLLRESRRHLAKDLNVHPLELIFTSGGSEANNLGIQGLLKGLEKAGGPIRKKILVSGIEHPSVMKTVEAMGDRGYDVLKIPVDTAGRLDLSFYKKHLDEDVALVSVMLANNEVGAIQPLEDMVPLAKAVGAYFHTDCVQALGKIDFDLPSLGVDLASFSGHKVYALKGAGLLYIKKKTPMVSQIFGGPQERGRRAGTENLLAIGSLSFMVGRMKNDQAPRRVQGLRDQMEASLVQRIHGLRVVGDSVPRLPNTSCMMIDGVDGEALMMNLDIKGFAVSTGAACSSGNPDPSPVLLAMGLTRQQAQSSLRVSLGASTTEPEIKAFGETLEQVVAHLRTIQQNHGESRGE